METAPAFLIDLRERMVRIETKLDSQAEKNVSVRQELDDHAKRLSSLEASHKLVVSIGAILLFLVTFFQEQIASILA